MYYVLVLAIICSVYVRSSSGISPVECPCANKQWCQPIKTTPVHEVFIFSVNKNNWQLYDWTRVTTIVQFGYIDPELMCHAHSKGVRVVTVANFPVVQLTNASTQAMWVAKQIMTVKNNFLDGINIDFESPIIKSNASARNGMTALVQAVTDGLKKYIKTAQVTFDFAWSPDCIDQRCYNYTEIAKIIDFVFVMSYDERSQIYGDCIAWANSAINTTVYGVKKFISMGIPSNKIVLGVPWYGYDYPCITLSKDVCHLKKVPFRGVNCSDAAGKEVSFSVIQGSLLKNSTSGRQWSSIAESPYFNYKDNSGQMHQVWYDDVKSLTYKYDIALKLKLRGVGMWNADSLNYTKTAEGDRERKEMWGALPKRGY